MNIMFGSFAYTHLLIAHTHMLKCHNVIVQNWQNHILSFFSSKSRLKKGPIAILCPGTNFFSYNPSNARKKKEFSLVPKLD